MSKITNRFSSIINNKNTINNLITQINEKIKYLMDLYINLVQNNNNNKLDTITTDSFYFQIKLIKSQLNNYENMFININKQIYSDYYKLIKFIEKYIENKFDSSNYSDVTTIVKKFSPYRIIDISNNYNINSSEKIYCNIVESINALIKYLDDSNENLLTTRKSLNTGIDIENFLDSIKFNIDLFTNFLNGYSKYHETYLINLIRNLENFYKDITYNIYFDRSTLISGNIYNKSINENINENINKSINENITENIDNNVLKNYYTFPYNRFILNLFSLRDYKYNYKYNYKLKYYLGFILINVLSLVYYQIS